MDKTQYIFGFGTGRCGTSSLAHLLDIQPNARVSHEQFDIHWFPAITDYTLVREAIRERARQYELVGDICYAWIQYLPRLVEDFPTAKFIYIWRDKEEVIDSFWERNKDRIDNPLENRPNLNKCTEYLKSFWNLQYPFLGYPPTKECIRNTIERYSALTQSTLFRFAKRTYMFNMKNLNLEKSVHNLLNFVGVPKEEQVIEIVKQNVGGKPVSWKEMAVQKT